MITMNPDRRLKTVIQVVLIIVIFIALICFPLPIVHFYPSILSDFQRLPTLPIDRQILLNGVYAIQFVTTVMVCTVATMVLFRRSLYQALQDLGLTGNFKAGWLIGFIATVPMLIIFSVFGHEIINTNILQQIAAFAIIPGLLEEILFRGFVFGLLYRRIRLGFWFSILLPTVLFAAGHLYQVHGIEDSIGILAVTGFGSILFAWLYVRWEYNLWVPIAFHTLINFWTQLFYPVNTALGAAGDNNVVSEFNVARLVTILLSILLTLHHCHWDLRKSFVNIRPQDVSPIAKVPPTIA